MTTGETGEFGYKYSLETLLAYYEGLARPLEEEIRGPEAGLHEIIRLYAPDFDPSEFPEDGLGQAELLIAAGEVIGDKTDGRPRWEILEKKRRKGEAPLDPRQAAYVTAMARYLGGRFPRTTEDGITERPGEDTGLM